MNAFGDWIVVGAIWALLIFHWVHDYQIRKIYKVLELDKKHSPNSVRYRMLAKK